MTINLLSHLQSFAWTDLQVSKEEMLDDLTEVIELIRKYEAKLYGHPEFYILQLPWGYFYEIVDNDYNIVRQNISWLRKDHYKTLQRILHAPISGRPSRSIEELEDEFSGNLNGMISCQLPSAPSTFVFDKVSFHELRVIFFTQNSGKFDYQKSPHPFLPNLNYSNYYLASLQSGSDFVKNAEPNEVTELANVFCTETFRRYSPGGEKEAKATEIGQEVARRNFYRYCQEISSEEQQRRGSLRSIFSLHMGDNISYVSIDFEKGSFEWCNQRGEHQGEFLFNGIMYSKADKSGEHDIWTISRS